MSCGLPSIIYDYPWAESMHGFNHMENISTFVYYPLPFHLQKAFQKLIRKVGTLNISTQLCKEVLSLPIHPWLTNSQINYVIKCIKEILNGYNITN